MHIKCNGEGGSESKREREGRTGSDTSSNMVTYAKRKEENKNETV